LLELAQSFRRRDTFSGALPGAVGDLRLQGGHVLVDAQGVGF